MADAPLTELELELLAMISMAGLPRQSDGEQVYEDDWWNLTRAGRAAIGEKPRGDERA